MRKRQECVSMFDDQYEDVDTVPDGLKWKRGEGRASRIEYSMGKVYRRKTVDGVVTLSKLIDDPRASPVKKIDSEPERLDQVRYKVNTHCWYVDDGGVWYLCRVVSRQGTPLPKRITLSSVTGWDAEHKTEWPYGEEFQFTAQFSNACYRRLRPLRARQV